MERSDKRVLVKVKWPRYRPGVAQRVGRGIALLFHYRGTRRGWVVSSTTRPHFSPGEDPVLILQAAGWAPGPVWTGGKSRPHYDSIPDRPACSQSLPTELPGPQTCSSAFVKYRKICSRCIGKVSVAMPSKVRRRLLVLCLPKKTTGNLVAVTQFPDYLFCCLYDSSSPHLLVWCGCKVEGTSDTQTLKATELEGFPWICCGQQVTKKVLVSS